MLHQWLAIGGGSLKFGFENRIVDALCGWPGFSLEGGFGLPKTKPKAREIELARD